MKQRFMNFLSDQMNNLPLLLFAIYIGFFVEVDPQSPFIHMAALLKSVYIMVLFALFVAIKSFVVSFIQK